MARKKQTRGSCVFCGKEMTKGGLTRHLQSCAERQKKIETADAGRGRKETIYHLQVQDAWDGDYWLQLEMRGGAELVDLDEYLRAIWLECCGHLTAFTIAPNQYTQIFEDSWLGSSDRSMEVPVREVFAVGQEIPYEYDFGDTSHLVIKVIAAREGKALTRKPIFLMARNLAPEFSCQECGQPAQWFCLECVYEEEKPGLLCDRHADEHTHTDYGEPMPLVNSPRLGMCGYDGPAEPPY